MLKILGEYGSVRVENPLRVLQEQKKYLFIYYYIVVFTIYLLSVFTSIVRPGVIATIIILTLFIFSFPTSFDFIDFLVVMYIGYNLVTIIFNFNNNMPISVGISEFVNSALPVLFYFIVKQYNNYRDEFYKWFLYASIMCYSIGLFWYYTLPSYYIDFLIRTSQTDSLAAYINDKRFCSFLGSTSIGLLAPITAILAYDFLTKTKQKRYVFMFYMSIGISILTHQRASYLMILLAILLVHLRFFKKKVTKYLIVIEAIVLVTASIYIFTSSSGVFNNILSVFQRFGTAISSRSNQWLLVKDLGYKIIFGNGLGSMSHKALGYSAKLINDGAYFKLLGELGIIGLLLFVSLLFVTFDKLIMKKYIKYYKIEAYIILMFLIQSIGSNNLFFQEAAPVFWISIGFIFSKKNSTNLISKSHEGENI